MCAVASQKIFETAMRHPVVAAILLVLPLSASALSLGPDEFAAAKRLTCVLAQDSLGYLEESDYAEQTGKVLEAFDGETGDVVYAKALGYFDGLMFGIPEHDGRAVAERLRTYLDSRACGDLTAVQFEL